MYQQTRRLICYRIRTFTSWNLARAITNSRSSELETIKRTERPFCNYKVDPGQFRRLHSHNDNNCHLVRADVDGDYLTVSWSDEIHSKFYHVWLRDHCRCKECYDGFYNEKLTDILEIPLHIKPKEVQLMEGNKVQITWPDGHISLFDGQWLKNHSDLRAKEKVFEDEPQPILWDSNISSLLPQALNYDEAIQDDAKALELSKRIRKYGFAFLRDTPCKLKAIELLANALAGYLKETAHGRVWEIGGKKSMNFSRGYTSSALNCHTDHCYFNDSRSLQILHCVEHSGEGGLSLLVDGFNAAYKLQREDPDSFRILCETNVSFRYGVQGTVDFKAYGSIITLHPLTKKVEDIRYKPNHLATLDWLKPDDAPKFYKALQTFVRILRTPENEFHFKLSPGKLVIMENTRVLHGRSAYTGTRHMMGCYVSRDDFLSKYRVRKWP